MVFKSIVVEEKAIIIPKLGMHLFPRPFYEKFFT